MALPKMYVNSNLKADGGKIYNAHYSGCNIILTPCVQRPSGSVTYAWRLTHQHHTDDSVQFNSAKLALKNAIEVLDKWAGKCYAVS